MKNKHTPMLRLRSAPVGSIVALPAIRRHKSFYLGGRDADGYSYLWASKGAKDDGLNWLVMAAGSHEVVMAWHPPRPKERGFLTSRSGLSVSTRPANAALQQHGTYVLSAD